MSKIATPDSKRQTKLFHNQSIDVYPTSIGLDEIDFWPENNRTVFTFDRLAREKKKSLDKLSIDDITDFVAQQDVHKLDDLAKSIGRNGVRVPLIIRDDGVLLDGNRRFFACHWLRIKALKSKEPRPPVIDKIPALIIRQKDLTEISQLKIIAEANFIPDLKVDWPLDAQARAVDTYFRKVKREKHLDDAAALIDVTGVFGISRQRALDLIDTLAITEEFVAGAPDADKKFERRAIVEDKFVYLWEFRNKAMKGRSAYQDEKELDVVKKLFFDMMARGPDNPIRNVKWVEPMVQSKRDKTAWSLLTISKGAKLSVIVSMMNEKKEIRKAEDKIRLFHGWLDDTKDHDLTSNAKSLLRELAKLARTKSEVSK